MIKLVTTRLLRMPDRTLGWQFILGHDGLTLLAKLAILELPWRGNANGRGDYRKASCIPVGLYKVTPRIDARLGFVLDIHDVPNRSGIMQHWGGKPQNTLGCLCMGAEFRGHNVVKQGESKRKLKALFGKEAEALLVIVDAS